MSSESDHDNDVDPYHDVSDSDGDYNENEQILLKNLRKRQYSDSESEEEVLGVAPSDGDDTSNSDIALSDVEGDEKTTKIPDLRAWGQNKRQYYATDYVDPDFGGFQGHDAELADFEETEARDIQKQLAQQLADDDFTLDFSGRNTTATTVHLTTNSEAVPIDVSKLTKRQKIELIKNDCPELFGLLDDFRTKITFLQNDLGPVVNKKRQGPRYVFNKAYYELILNYCVNIQMYFVLKTCSKVKNLTNHPLIKRLNQYRSLIGQYETIYRQKTASIRKEKRQKLGILNEISATGEKHVRFADAGDELKQITEASAEEGNEEEEETTIKRAINYQIAKNKGLTPNRKKEQRNPRVKHRNRYRKATIRRRGAVRQVRPELKRYAGELSGIKATVCKSVKIKT